MYSGGWRVHAAAPAMANEAAITFRRLRRSTPCGICPERPGNSCSMYSRRSSLCAASSSVRQNVGPRPAANFSRRAAISRAGLRGGSSSDSNGTSANGVCLPVLRVLRMVRVFHRWQVKQSVNAREF